MRRFVLFVPFVANFVLEMRVGSGGAFQHNLIHEIPA
jgi:hypothetical protein